MFPSVTSANRIDANLPGSGGRLECTAVIGAGIVGSTVAWALAREGRKVLLLDRSEPGLAGASFGNAGHIATEQVQPLPSPVLLWTFWRELFVFGGRCTFLPGACCPSLPGCWASSGRRSAGSATPRRSLRW